MTYILAEDVSERAVLDAIRAARTVSRDGEGVMYGDPALVRVVQDSLAERPQESGAERWHSLASVVVLSGLALLVLVK